MTQYTKMFFELNHAEFNNTVTYAKNKYQSTSDILWWRFQLYF
jgi:hypothetical protein